MKQNRRKLSVILIISFLILSCGTVPITGRKQLNLIPQSTMLSMSFQEYDTFLENHQVVTHTEEGRMVQKVGRNIKIAVENYFAEQGESGELREYEWEFNLVKNSDVNAWCMPGGKVVIYTGILPITKDEAGLAVVMGHEIAHAVAEHGNERMSQGLVAQFGHAALSKALEKKPEETRNLWMTAFGIGTQVGVLLPYSRLHEKEADRLGLIFMAMAGYHPNEAVDFWQRMSAKKGGASVPEFLSTHPSDQSRINNLRQLVPEAMEYYRN
jgi:predicted Zn-dependent protease